MKNISKNSISKNKILLLILAVQSISLFCSYPYADISRRPSRRSQEPLPPSRPVVIPPNLHESDNESSIEEIRDMPNHQRPNAIPTMTSLGMDPLAGYTVIANLLERHRGAVNNLLKKHRDTIHKNTNVEISRLNGELYTMNQRVERIEKKLDEGGYGFLKPFMAGTVVGAMGIFIYANVRAGN